MNPFPNAPVSPREFIEEVIPSLFAEVVLDERAEALDFKIGLVLEGEDGGEWTLHFIEGELGIADALAPDCALTILQSVADWRSGLWEGHPRLVADAVNQLKAGLDRKSSSGVRLESPRNLEALRDLDNLSGRVDAIIEGDREGIGEGISEGDWRIGVRVGAGPIPKLPDATIQVGSGQAEAIRSGRLHPLEALMTGQLRLEGDLGLVLQLQAIAMAASLPRRSGN
jgi:putative sterol carrier protein